LYNIIKSALVIKIKERYPKQSRIKTNIKFDIKILLDYENPYLEDDLYDRITDRVVEWSIAQNGPIRREKDPKQYR